MGPESSDPMDVQALEEFQRNEPRTRAARVVASLGQGMALLCNLLYRRLHEDVEKTLGRDSVWMPLSEAKAESQTKLEIEVYQCVESAETVRQHHYLQTDGVWYLQWLLRNRLARWPDAPGVSRRVAQYACQQPEQRRLEFSNVLSRTLAESRQVPLVLYRLFPLAVAIATSVAFGDHESAQETRKQQRSQLLAIGDCSVCQGSVLESGESCEECGNPVWKFAWLMAD